ncbi:hypothetical protein FIS3754_19170 [Fischerella sp. NIES-3754]|nr:hypothetical protein FIS3754_19170 [Fischerella sp. NIES-3754]BCX08289.1 MAG: hypothetical protein KatS3mg066_2148 [Fischerella sp.]
MAQGTSKSAIKFVLIAYHVQTNAIATGNTIPLLYASTP